MSWEGGEAFNDFMDHIRNMNDSKREKGMKEAIAESKSLTHGHRMGSNSPGNSEISGSLVGRITKKRTLVYGKRRTSETDLKIEMIKKALSDFAKQVKTK